MLNDVVQHSYEIPDAPYYVCANDKFMSGWGDARGKINTLIFPCDTILEVDRIMNVLESNDSMRYVRVCYTKPRLKPSGYLYQVKESKDWS